MFWRLAVLLVLSHVKKWRYSILCMNLVWTALHLFHFEISDLTPPSGSESGEAALRRLLACRAIGGYAMSSDDPSPGSPTVFQSSRLARPQDY